MKKAFILAAIITCLLMRSSCFAQTPGLVQHVQSGHNGIAGQSSFPTTLTQKAFDPILANNLFIHVFSWCGAVYACTGSGAAGTVISDKLYASGFSGASTTLTQGPCANNTSNVNTCLYYGVGVPASAGSLQTIFSSAVGDFPWITSQWYNIDTSSAPDCTASSSTLSGTTMTLGCSQTNSGNDLYFMACIQAEGQFTDLNTGAISPGAGSTLQSASRFLSEASVTEVFSGAGTHNLSITFANNDGAAFNCVLAAFRAASAGNAASGMHVAHYTYYEASSSGSASTDTDDFPTIGNLVVIASSAQTIPSLLSSVSDTTNGSYVVDIDGNNAYPYFAHKVCASSCAGNPLRVTVTYTSGHTVDYFNLYDIVGANATQPDTGIACPSPSTKTGNVCINTASQSGSSIANAANITPSAPGIVFDFGELVGTGVYSTGITSPSGAIFNCMAPYTGETDSENYCAGQSYSYYNNSGTAALNFTWTISTTGNSSPAAAISFTQASGVSAAPLPPTNLSVTVQ